MENGIEPKQTMQVTISDADGNAQTIDVLCRIDTRDEAAYYLAGGILQYVLDGIDRD